ncbi:MAG: hypothetical protein JNG90_19875 [Planctomycetaceae bacterium]|nr:hypothetical protein [Planctomycetaceae bacterium]
MRRSKKMKPPTKQAWAILWDEAGQRPGRLTVTLEWLAFEGGCSVRSAGRQLKDVARVGLATISEYDSVWTVDLVDPLDLDALRVAKTPPRGTRPLPIMAEEEGREGLGENAAKTPRIRRENAEVGPLGGNAADSPRKRRENAEPTAPPPAPFEKTQAPSGNTFAEQRAAREAALARDSQRVRSREDLRPKNLDPSEDLRHNPPPRPTGTRVNSGGEEPAPFGSIVALAAPEAQATIALANARVVEALTGYILQRVSDPKFHRSLARRAAEAVGVGRFTRESLEQILRDLDAHVRAGTLQSTKHAYFFGALWKAFGELGVPREQWADERRLHRERQHARDPPA